MKILMTLVITLIIMSAMTFQAEEDQKQEINGLGRKAKVATYMGVSKQSSIPNMESSNDDDDNDDSNPSFNTYTHGSSSGTESHHHYTTDNPPIWTKNKNNKHY
ncbi:unnamed protein product [Amaranthus hypochondriacus]